MFSIEFELYSILSIVCCQIGIICTQEFASHFKNCRTSASTFDSCLKNALNDVRPFFKSGLPEYGINSFDPFFSPKVEQAISIPNINYSLTLKNIYESGWTSSKITQLKCNFNKNKIQYTQFFPDKELKGDYEYILDIFGGVFGGKGTWNLTLQDYKQSTTLTRKPRKVDNGTLVYDTPIKVDVNAISCKNLQLHITNLFSGRAMIENLLDQLINTAWQPGFLILRPFINNLVSMAFSEIFTKNFQCFPFEKIIPN